MFVYTLLGGYEYEGYSLLGVYASREDAVAAYDANREYLRYDNIMIDQRAIGGPAGTDECVQVEYL